MSNNSEPTVVSHVEAVIAAREAAAKRAATALEDYRELVRAVAYAPQELRLCSNGSYAHIRMTDKRREELMRMVRGWLSERERTLYDIANGDRKAQEDGA